MLAEFGGAIDRVRIDGLEDGTFLAKVDAEQYHGGERAKKVFDARPSDAIALALREESPIEVSDDVIDQAGRSEGEFDARGAFED
jgi:bifunctional DNase/RNase